MEKTFNKLVRDNIPQIIKDNGGKAITRVLSDEEFRTELIKKLYEEYNEVVAADKDNILEELADMIEVIRYLAICEGSSLEDVIEISKTKVLKRGAFNKKIFLERTID